MYYACVFLMYEVSTPFVHLHWFADKLQFSKTFKHINGILLFVTFLIARILSGTWHSVLLAQDIWKLRSELNLGVCLAIGVCNILSHALNYSWFVILIREIRKEMSAPEKDERKRQ